MKLALTLFALAAAADSQGADTTTDQGYGTQAEESYSAPAVAYSAPSYAVAAPKCCVHDCPSHAPYFSVAQCGCVAGVQYATPAYAAASYEAPSYGEEQQSYGEEQQSGYR